MRLKKITSGLMALICSVGITAYMPTVAEKAFASEIVDNDFEVNYDGWYGNSDTVQLTAENGKGYNGSRGMNVSGRISANDGASSSKGFYLSGAVDYNYSVQVYSETDETFHLSLLCIDEETGTETVINLADKKVKAGKWTEISADYKAPANSYEFRLTLNTDSINDFVFDEVKITSKNGFSASAAGEKGLKDEFADYFRVGNILNGNTIKNSAITANIIKDCNSIECENEMKPDATLVQSQCSDTNIGVSLNQAAAIMDFCVQNNIAMRGHTFVWHSQTPVWFFKENFDANGNWVTPDVMDKRMESYIKNMFSAIEQQYPELNLFAYDVANECVSDDSNRTANFGGAREPGDNNAEGGKSGWVAVYGNNSFVEKAFTYARRYAPEGCDLYYNDYNEYWDHKRDTIYNMCKSLYEKGLLDGVGMQSHVPANATGFAGTDSYIEAMKKYLSIGCDVQISELDIALTDSNGNVVYSLQEQADKYKAIFKAAMDWNANPQSDGRVTLVAVWGPNDANSWLRAGSDALLYDKKNQPKLAYTTLTSMIPQSEWGDGSNYQGGTVKPVEPNEYGWYFADGFEGSTCDWNTRGSGEVLTSGRTSYVGDESLLVKDRKDAWNGASKSLNPRVFSAGNEYSFSANVMYFDGDATDKFYMKLQYTDANGDTQYDTIAGANAIKGEWVQLANKNYKIPSDASDMQIYIETDESTNNFYIDEVIGAVAGTTIIGAGESENIILGDINSDGVIDSFDIVLARKGLVNGFSDSAEKTSADVDCSGEYNISDAVLIQKFVLGQINEFPVADKPVQTVNPSDYMENAEKSLSEYALEGCTEEHSGVEYGTLTKYQYYSTTRERMTNVNVLLPPGYSENETYPVLYAMHGYWENEDSLAAMGKVRNMLGNLISTGDAEKMIVVFPYIYTSKTQEACSGLDLANSLNYDNFINDLTTDLMPYINSNFSVKTGRENTAITGFSMGGRESLFIGLTRSDLFGYVGAACPAPGLTPGADLSMHPGQLQESQLKPSYDMPYLLMVTGGGKDGTVGNQPSLYHNILNNNGIDHIWHSVTSGGHDASSVQPHFYNYLRFIFKAN